MELLWLNWLRSLRRRTPVFAFVDPDVSTEPFFVFFLRKNFFGALLEAGAFTGGSEDGHMMVETPDREIYDLGSMHGSYDMSLWVERARASVVDLGSPGLATLGTSRRFSKKYG